ncbi:MAG TPA: MAPEG family protein [Kofleriaceae bacterium]
MFSAALSWLMIFFAAAIKERIWSPAGLKGAVGNRTHATAPTALAGRADRAAKNMSESLPLFIALVAAAHLGGRVNDRLLLGAQLFFWMRVAYWLVYLIGIPYVRTVIWLASIAGLAIMLTALF